MQDKPTPVEELASTCGTSPKKLRSYLRKAYPQVAPGQKGKKRKWNITPAMWEETLRDFHPKVSIYRAKPGQKSPTMPRKLGVPKPGEPTERERIAAELRGDVNIKTGELLPGRHWRGGD